ncbi:MAG: hypothetical protein HY560_05820 [Gemmatimonadetes bacterium]|nr:hypothetical protein [Gemmatimonadota bacterium]
MTVHHEGPLSARSLADEYAGLRTRSGGRVLELVRRGWGDRGESDCRNLAQVLMAILEPLNRRGAEVTDGLRAACEDAVTDWLRRTTPVRGLLDGAGDSQPDHGGPPRSAPGRRRLVRLVSAEVTPQAVNGRFVVRVRLERGTRHYMATTGCRPDILDQLRGGAEATLEALRQAMPTDSPRLALLDVSTFEAFDRLGGVVSLSLMEDTPETLIGVCPDIRSEPVRAAAVAVLQALNRRLGIG